MYKDPDIVAIVKRRILSMVYEEILEKTIKKYGVTIQKKKTQKKSETEVKGPHEEGHSYFGSKLEQHI